MTAGIAADLWEMRVAAGLSLGELARRSGVNTSTLSRWEAGMRLPRIPELESVLAALGATSATRARLFAGLGAPRALRHLRGLAADVGLSAPPAGGDLLCALRLRRGWTQERAASHVGVSRPTLNRWERGERIPSTEEVHSLCYHLGAREEEIGALTAARFSDPPAEKASIWEECAPDALARLSRINHGHFRGWEDLHYLLLEREAWGYALKSSSARAFLAWVYVHHGHTLRLDERWSESRPLAEKALALALKEASCPMTMLRAMILTAVIAVHGGAIAAPKRGFQLLKPFVLRTDVPPEYAAWALADMAEYLALAGEYEAALDAGKRACDVAERCDNPMEPYLRRCDYGQRLVQAGRPEEALRVAPDPPTEYSGADQAPAILLLVEAHRLVGNLSEAHDWLLRASDLVETQGIARLRPKIEALAARF